jgi:glycosyltransferase involved in cell wall biosynthesis
MKEVDVDKGVDASPMRTTKKTIAYLNPGPNYRPRSFIYQNQFKGLSQGLNGYILTTGSKSEVIRMHGFVYISIPYRGSPTRIVNFLLFCWWFARKMAKRRRRIELVATYDPLSTGMVGLMLSRMLKAKFAPEVNGVYTSSAEWLDVKPGLLTSIKKAVYPAMMRFVLKHADGVRLLFPEQVNSYSREIQGKVVHSFPCYVPVEDFRNAGEKSEVLFVGFPYRRKGVDILIQAFKQVADRYPEWKLKILGWYPNPRELMEAIGGHPQIYHHNPVPYAEMIEHIGSCAILVLPSRSEAMGRVLVEAMAAGKARIGSDVDGIPSVITDGVDGLLFEPGNVGDLARKLEMLMGDAELRRRLGKAGEARAREQFSLRKYGENMNRFYAEVIAQADSR